MRVNTGVVSCGKNSSLHMIFLDRSLSVCWNFDAELVGTGIFESERQSATNANSFDDSCLSSLAARHLVVDQLFSNRHSGQWFSCGTAANWRMPIRAIGNSVDPVREEWCRCALFPPSR